MSRRLKVSYKRLVRLFAANVVLIDLRSCRSWQQVISNLPELPCVSVVIGSVRFQRLLKLMFIVEHDVNGRWRTSGL